jgi:hypothetical protein
LVWRGDEMTRVRTFARPLAGWMNAKSSTNSFSVWLSRTRLQYVPCATSSSIWTWSFGEVGSSDMGRTYPERLAARYVVRAALRPYDEAACSDRMHRV